MWETVSAFSNTAGGWIVLGVKETKNENGINTYSIVGVPNVEKTEQEIAGVLRSVSKFNVPILANVRRFVFEDKTVLAYWIPASDCKPVFINNNLNNTYLRVGSADQRATDIEISILLREKTFGSKSEMRVPGTTLGDLSVSSIETYRRRLRDFNPELRFNTLSLEDFCEQTGISDNGCLTFGGLLAFGKREVIVKQIRNFWIDYREVPGTSYEDAEIRYTYRMPEQENLWEYYNILIQRLKTFVDNPFMPGPDGFSPEDNSQLYCLREGLVNMLAHADYFSPIHSTVIVYTDKVEFQNPGQFPIVFSNRNRKVKSVPRNPNLIMFFRYARLAENAGYGIGKILEWEKLTGEPVDIESDLAVSTVTYHRNQGGQKSGQKSGQNTYELSKRERIIRFIAENPKITRAKLSEQLGIAPSAVQKHIDALKADEIIERVGGAKDGYWKIIRS